MSRPATLRDAAALARGKPHGVRIKYMGGCRCLPCRSANGRYETERSRRRKRGEHGRIVSAAKAREKLRRLSRAGLGYKRAADVAGVARSIAGAIVRGERPRIRATTERKILRVTARQKAPHAIVDATATWTRIRWMLEHGARKAWIARALGCKTPALQLGRHRIVRRHEQAVLQLWHSARAAARRGGRA